MCQVLLFIGMEMYPSPLVSWIARIICSLIISSWPQKHVLDLIHGIIPKLLLEVGEEQKVTAKISFR